MQIPILTKQNDEFNFIDFTSILKNARNSFLDELSAFEIEYPVPLKKRGVSKLLRHSILIEVLKVYNIIDISKINVIIIDNSKDIYMGEFTEDNFKERCISILNTVKRKIPILIKRSEFMFETIEEHYEEGEFKQFESEIKEDRRRLSESICSFREFKQFAKRNGLSYIYDTLCCDLEFKKLFL